MIGKNLLITMIVEIRETLDYLNILDMALMTSLTQSATFSKGNDNVNYNKNVLHVPIITKNIMICQTYTWARGSTML